ncbi:hypothetical protein C6A85_11810, partial [Mycobacterium sp. ITM-2017-0098]
MPVGGTDHQYAVGRDLAAAGQVSQTATQEPAVNGTSGKAGPIVLRNIHISADQTSDYIRP